LGVVPVEIANEEFAYLLNSTVFGFSTTLMPESNIFNRTIEPVYIMYLLVARLEFDTVA
jgi:hypothetical protein